MNKLPTRIQRKIKIIKVLAKLLTNKELYETAVMAGGLVKRHPQTEWGEIWRELRCRAELFGQVNVVDAEVHLMELLL